jgi:osmoprotectant transport system permease protein
MADIINYFQNNSDAFWLAVREHIVISFIAVAVASVIAMPLGAFCSTHRRISAFVTGLFSTMRIIPSLAVLLICIPLIGTGVKPALVALCFLALPPLLINATLAFSSLPESVLETAEAMGMSRRRIFFTVKLPLAMPFLLAGLKSATTEVIASATLATYIGAGGLGSIIFTGFGLMRTDLLIVGGASVAILSLTADFLLTEIERRATRWQVQH